MLVRVVCAALGVVVLSGACATPDSALAPGGSVGTALGPETSMSTAGTAGPGAVAVANTAAGVMPSIEVFDLAGRGLVSLASLVATDRLTLFWAWAPT